MQSVTSSAKALVNNYAKITPSIYIDGEKLNTGIGLITYTPSCGSMESFGFGNGCAAGLSVRVDGAYPNLKGKRIEAKWSVDGTEYPLLTGEVESATVSANSTTIEAYDDLFRKGGMQFAVPDALLTECTADAALVALGDAMGVAVEDSTLTTAASVTLPSGLNGLGDEVCISQIAGYVAGLMGGNALMTRDGLLCVRGYSAVDFYTEPYAGGAAAQNEDYSVTGVTFQRQAIKTVTYEDGTTSEEEYTVIYSAGDGTLAVENPLADQAAADRAWAVLAGVTVRPGTYSFPGGLLLEPGDIFTVRSMDGTYPVAAVAMTMTLDGGCMTEASCGGDVPSGGVVGTINQALQTLQADLARVKQLFADNAQIVSAYITNLTVDQIKAGTKSLADVISNVQDQVDGAIESHYYNYAPTLSNIPASNWTTEELRVAHEGDLFFDKSTGYTYRFQRLAVRFLTAEGYTLLTADGSPFYATAWGWQRIKDTDISTLETSFEVLDGVINGAVSETGETEAGLVEKVAAVTLTADGLTSKVSNLGKTVSDVEQRVSSITLKVTGADGESTSIVINDGTIDLSGEVLAQRIAVDTLVAQGLLADTAIIGVTDGVYAEFTADGRFVLWGYDGDGTPAEKLSFELYPYQQDNDTPAILRAACGLDIYQEDDLLMTFGPNELSAHEMLRTTAGLGVYADPEDNSRDLLIFDKNNKQTRISSTAADFAGEVSAATGFRVPGDTEDEDVVLGSTTNLPTETYYNGVRLDTRFSAFPGHGAGSHNAVYRGKDLGEEVEIKYQEQILNGTFDDLYIGDYWTINGVVYRIAAFDYYYNTGDTACKTHHVTLVPDTALYSCPMNSTGTTDGAYVNSLMYTEGLDEAKSIITEAFGGVFGILNHRTLLADATTAGYESHAAFYNSTVELMTEANLLGYRNGGNAMNGTAYPYNYSLDQTQFPLFRYRPDLIGIRTGYFLRDVVSDKWFAAITANGAAGYYTAANNGGVRPSFSVYCNSIG